MARRKTIILALGLVVAAVAAVATAVGLPPSNAPGCPVFPADNPWNQRVDGAPVLPQSGAYISRMGSDASVFADFSIPYVSVSGKQRRVPVKFHYWRESDRGRYPIPPKAPLERGTPDRHLIVLDRDRCKLYELYQAQKIAGGRRWRAGSGATWNLRSNRLRPRGWTSADAAGLPMFPGLARIDEVKRGVIDHALRFTAEGIGEGYVYPARHSDGSGGGDAPPMGTRLRLRAGFDTSTFPPQARVVLEALKRYGMILADTGPAYSLGGAPSRAWNYDTDLDTLRRVKGRDLEVVDTRGLPRPGE